MGDEEQEKVGHRTRKIKTTKPAPDDRGWLKSLIELFFDWF